jgi:dTDP-4-dehydrorhamnose reductase
MPHEPPNDRLPLPLLITGLPGVPGFNAWHYFREKYPGQVIGIRQADNEKIQGPDVVPCNAEDEAGIARLFEKYRFRSVLDCAGNCALKQCEVAPEIAWRINVEGLQNLVSQTAPRGLRLVHLSCDLVFSGDRREGGYVEEDPTDPVTVYGKTMAAGEEFLAKADPSAAILRISLPMGISANGHAGAIDWITSRFKKNRPATMYTDEIRTPTYTDCMNLLYETMLCNDLRGIYHAGGPRRMTLYQIAQVINRVGGYNPDCLHGIPRREAAPIPPRAGNVSMNSEKLIRALGYDPFDAWPYCDSLMPDHDRWHYERPSGIEHSPRRLHRVLCRNPLKIPAGGRCIS